MNETELPSSLPRYGAPSAPVADALLVAQDVRRGRERLAEALGDRAADVPNLRVADNGDVRALAAALSVCLAHARVGLRLYLVGDEAFIWPLHAAASAAGLGEDEIELLRDGPPRRLVRCVHCGNCQPASEAHIVCAHCGVALEVRHHFSRLHGAYLGVCADVDRPYAEARA